MDSTAFLWYISDKSMKEGDFSGSICKKPGWCTESQGSKGCERSAEQVSRPLLHCPLAVPLSNAYLASVTASTAHFKISW